MHVENRPVVYISGPITKGDRNWNVFQGFDAHKALMENGFAPINPIASCTFPFAWEETLSHSDWMAVWLPIIERCDALLRLDGESRGADEECTHALAMNIPVYPSVTSLVEGFRQKQFAANASKRRRANC